MEKNIEIKTLISTFGGVVDSVIPGLGSAISTVGNDFAERQLSKLELERVCRVISVARERINKRLESGDTIRDDGFIRKRLGSEPTTQEIVEGILTKAKNEYINSKNYHLGLFLSGLAFSRMDRSEANFLLNVFSQITYRQMIILLLFYKLESEKNISAQKFWNESKFNSVADQHPSFSAEIFGLMASGLLHGGRNSFSDNIRFTNLGKIFSESFYLFEIEKSYIEPISERILNPSTYYRTQ